MSTQLVELLRNTIKQGVSCLVGTKLTPEGIKAVREATEGALKSLVGEGTKVTTQVNGNKVDFLVELPSFRFTVEPD